MGDAQFMFDSAAAGDDTLTGGNSTNGDVFNYLFGDGVQMQNSAKGGNDRLIAGSQSGLGAVVNHMWGDGELMLGSAQGGSDVFVLGNSVGTNNFVEDFQQGLDKIEFSQVAGIAQFSDLNSISTAGSDTVISSTLNPSVSVTLAGFTGTLTPTDIQFT
jgi:hypothetical protein